MSPPQNKVVPPLAILDTLIFVSRCARDFDTLIFVARCERVFGTHTFFALCAQIKNTRRRGEARSAITHVCVSKDLLVVVQVSGELVAHFNAKYWGSKF